MINENINSNQNLNENIQNLQKDLIQMGFNLDLVNLVITKFKVNNLNEAIDYLDKVNINQISNNINNSQEINQKIRKINSDKNVNNPKKLNEMSIIKDNNLIKVKSITHLTSSQSKNVLDNSNFDINSEFSKNNFVKININLQKENINLQEFICEICYESYNSINNELILPCKESICKSCISLYLSNKINSSDVEMIKCPNHKCQDNFIFGEKEISKLLENEQFLKYKKFIRRAKLRKNPDIILCPIENCESFAYKNNNNNNLENEIEIKNKNNLNVNLIQQNYIDEENKFVKCLNNHDFCIKCFQQPHLNIDCEIKIENEFQIYVKDEKIKNCPKCNFFIKKSDGCNHMTCGNPQCKFEFCWICLDVYNVTHFTEFSSRCYGLQNADENDFFVRFLFLRRFNFIFIFIWRFILIILLFTIPTILISFAMINDQIRFNRGPFIRIENRMHSDFNKFMFRIINNLFIFFMGICLISAGYLSMMIGVLLLPFVIIAGFIVALFFSFGPGRRILLNRRRNIAEEIE